MVFSYIKSSYDKIKSALGKARSFFSQKISTLFLGKIDEQTLEQLEQLFYEADFGVQLAHEITEKVRVYHRAHPGAKQADYLQIIQSDLIASLESYNSALIEAPKEEGPTVILIVGVNGNGKTTTIAKLANLFTTNQKKVLIGAADTFRAAATEQIEIWANRLSIDVVKGISKCDPSAVTFDAVQAGISRQAEIVLVDTAGRLHTKIPLMQELEKIKRTCKKLLPHAPHETLLVLDATTGQNGIEQAKHFHKYIPLTGIILTKLDGTAKGGITLAIQRELQIPIKFICTGEQIEDIHPFNAKDFVLNLFD